MFAACRRRRFAFNFVNAYFVALTSIFAEVTPEVYVKTNQPAKAVAEAFPPANSANEIAADTYCQP
jgi:hypothetical protein